MGIGVNPFVWAGFSFIWSSLAFAFVTGIYLGWRYRLRPAIRARQKHAQALMMILCFIIGTGWSISSLLFYANDEEDGIQTDNIYKLVLCMTFLHYASMNVYFYRVWRLCYKFRLQNAFEKVREAPATLNQRSILSHILSLNLSYRALFSDSNVREQSEHLISWPRQTSVSNSWFVRYRNTLGRSRVNKIFWSLVWIAQCNIVFWTQPEQMHHTTFTWSPDKFADNFFTCGFQFLCFIVLFAFPGDDHFRIKIELRLIFFINILETLLYYILVWCGILFAAYMNLAICQCMIIVAITWSNYRAVRSQSFCTIGPIVREVSSYSDVKMGKEIGVTDVLECPSLFQAFERHLKREFTLEHLNFIVAVVHFRRLCDERNRGQSRKIKLIRGEDDVPKSREISMQAWDSAMNVCGSDTSNGSSVATSTLSSAGRRVSSNRRRSRPTPRLHWIKSQIKREADKQTTATFIFDEYCDRGAPQEINLSKEDRDHLIQFFSHSELDDDELSNIFNRAFDSVLDLLENDSLRRFRRCSSFDKNSKDLLVKNVYDVNPDRKSLSCRTTVL